MLPPHRPMRAAALAAALAIFSGCDDEPTGPGPAVALGIQPPSNATLAIGDTLRLTAIVVDAFGRPVPRAPIDWESLDPAVAEVDPTGLVTALDGGAAQIVAESGALADTVELMVIAVPKETALVSEAAAALYRHRGRPADLPGRPIGEERPPASSLARGG